MTPTDQFLCSALLPTEANQLRLRDLVQLAELDWATILERSKERGTVALLRYNLARASLLEAVPKTERDFLAAESQAWAAKQQVYVLEATRLIQTLQARGITSLPLKGAALMLGQYYPLPGLRAAVDVDLLVAPDQADAAFAIAEECGFVRFEVKKQARVPLPLPHELRHLPAMRGPRGVLLELHYRAFHDVRTQRDFGFAEMIGRAQAVNGTLLPAPEDVALHLLHHSVIDLTNAYACWRTFADLHFLLSQEPQAREKLLARAAEFQLRSAVTLAIETLQVLEEGRAEQAPNNVKLLLETALGTSTAGVMEAARLFEYLDLRQQPWLKVRHLYTLLTVSAATTTDAPTASTNKLQRVWGMLRRVNWRGVTMADLRRVLALRKLTLHK